MKQEFSTFSIRCDRKTRQAIARLAELEQRKAGDAVRRLVVTTVKALENKTASTSSNLAGGDVDAATSGADFSA